MDEDPDTFYEYLKGGVPPDEGPADSSSRDLADLLRAVAASTPLTPVTDMKDRGFGDLVGYCKFHYIAYTRKFGGVSARREQTLYVQFKEARFTCTRCYAQGDAEEFVQRLDASNRSAWTFRIVQVFRGGPRDGWLKELDPEEIAPEVVKVPRELQDPLDEDGQYTILSRSGDLLYYAWQTKSEAEQQARERHPLPDDDQEANSPLPEA